MCYGLVLSCVILQAIPYIRCIGESWPMTKERAYFETQALREHGRLSPDHVPEVYHFDRTMSLFGMRYLEPPHIILRKGLIAGTEYPCWQNTSRNTWQGLFILHPSFIIPLRSTNVLVRDDLYLLPWIFHILPFC